MSRIVFQKHKDRKLYEENCKKINITFSDPVICPHLSTAEVQARKLAYNTGISLISNAMLNPNLVVTPAAYLTLHYRLASSDGTDIVSTFNENPATLQLGTGQLAPFLEECLLGLAEGTHQIFDLEPEKAFGPRNPDLIQRISRATLDENSQVGEEYKVGDLIDFSAPSGGRFAGVLLSIDDETALFDFNHPLAGQQVRFEVRIIGIL